MGPSVETPTPPSPDEGKATRRRMQQRGARPQSFRASRPDAIVKGWLAKGVKRRAPMPPPSDPAPPPEDP
jgi:hypothetical protein